MSEERLERIEAILERTAQINQQTSEQQQHLAARFDSLAEQQQQITTRFDNLAEQQQQITARFDSLVFETQRVLNQLAERQTRTEASVETLADSVARLTQNAEADSIRWRETQAEIRRIWEYLLGQSRNGHGDV